METIALVGPIDIEAKAMISEITPSGFIIKEVHTEKEYSELYDANYIILRTLRLDAKVINSIPNLKLIQRWGVGYDTVDIEAAGKRNVPVAITAGVNAGPVSELAVLLMLAVYRNLIHLHNNVCQGKWRENIFRSYLINNKLVGFIGMGSIGKQVVPKVKGFGAKVQYYDVHRLSQNEEKEMGISYVEFEKLIETSDIISIHLPLNSSTRHMISKEVINKMKPNAIIINTSRGEIIVEDDLVEALTSRKILGAGLDVYQNEPVTADNPLTKLDNVVLTPHIGGNTADNNANMAQHCINNILKVSKGQVLSGKDVVNYEYMKY